MKLKKIITIILLLTTALFAISSIFRNPLYTDSYLHLATGKFVVKHRNLPTHQDFSFKKTQPSFEFISHSWLGDSIFYIAYASRIPYMVSFVLVVLLALTLYAINSTLSLLRVSRNIAYFALSVTTLLLISFWKAHPITFASCIMAWICYIYLDWSMNGSKAIFALPLLTLLYANVAGGFIFIPIVFIVIYLIYNITYQVIKKIKHKKSNLKTANKKFSSFYISSLCAIAVTYFNPLRLYIHIYTLTIFSILLSPTKTFSTLAGTLKILNQNFLKETPTTIYFALFTLYLVMLAINMLVLIVRKGSSYFSFIKEQLPLIFFAVLSLLWIRFIPIAVVLSTMLFAQNIQFSSNLLRPTKYANYLTIIINITLIILLELLIIFPPKQYDINKPDTQLNIIKNLDLPINYMTSPDLTSYFLFKNGTHVYLDAQDDLYDDNENLHYFVFEPYLSKKELSIITTKQNITGLLINKDFGQLPPNLGLLSPWRLLYFDYSGFLYVNNELLKINKKQDYALTHIDFSRNLGFDPKDATASAKELEGFIKKYPTNIMATGQLATIYRIQKQSQKAIDLLNAIPEAKRTYIVYTELGRAYAASGNCQVSEQMFLKALADRNETNFSRATLDLAVLYAICLDDKEKAKKYYERFNSYSLSPSERDNIRDMMSHFGIKLSN